MASTNAAVAELRHTVDAALASCLPKTSPTPEPSTATHIAPQLIDAMAYATMAGGKRLRPLLCCATAQAVGGDTSRAITAGCAIELIHTYSLIHDDLPAMDDDQLRRGKPTCHVRFNEAEAILAGDALQALAFELLSQQELPAEVCLAMILKLTQAVGWKGMVGGQSMDLALTGQSLKQKQITQAQLETLHRAKTGALLQASIELGAMVALVNTNPHEAKVTTDECRSIGASLGLAFQVIDDVLDVSQSTEQLGKDAGSDAAQGKTTFIDLLGESGARDYAYNLYEQAQDRIHNLPGDSQLLEAVGREVVFRDH